MEQQGSIKDTGVKDKLPIIQCENISKTFPGADGSTFEVLGNINLEVMENEFVVLLGPGQSGKTTLINIIAGLEEATSGRVKVNGKIVDKPGSERGVVYQETCLFPWLTVMGNVEFGPKARGISKKERRKHAQYLIELVGLKGFEDKHPNKLSGGMQQRVGIARAYCNDPLVLLMDEPFGHLDAQTRYLMEEEVQKIWENEKKTVIFVTNNIEEAIYLADRIVLLSNCPTEIFREYKVNLPRPRDYMDPEFLKLRQEITKEIEVTL